MHPLIESLKSIPGCEIDPIKSIAASVNGKGNFPGRLNNTIFSISFNPKKYCLLTVHCEGEWALALNSLLEKCGEYMGVEPICQYDEDDPARTTIEWDQKDPENRLIEIVNGGGVFARQNLKNIRLFGDRKLTDYECEEKKAAFAAAEAERIKNARIYGIDPGTLKAEKVATCTEWELFLDYYSITKFIWRMNHDRGRGHIDDNSWKSVQKDIVEMTYAAHYLVYTICKKCDIPVSEPEVDEQITPDKDVFMKWYSFYDNYFMHTLSDTEWNEFERRRKAGEDISEFLPKGDWRNS